MSAFLGALLGAGLLLIWQAGDRRAKPEVVRQGLISGQLRRAGLTHIKPAVVVAASIGGALLLACLLLVVTGVWTIALAAGVLGLCLPFMYLSGKRRKLLRARREEWPDVVDHLRSAVRSGLPISEALAQLATRGPQTLHAAFQSFAADLRVGRSVPVALESLRVRLDDPVADRIVAAVLLTREVGGADVGEMLRTLAGFLRADVHTRGELEARQSWTVNAARLAVAAPWIILVVLCLEPRVAAAYNSPTGVMVLLLGAVVAAISYRVMLRLARLDAIPGGAA